ncbi:zinc-finger double domain-containing protein [Ditylenchus destructor]|uniref:Zinc-finger double domain-containing protein n=1 Tax=Ditylenchus destructor TaxID=166010 RepID=A0AAD4QRW7_9BILA|nr:zinc-finger double domain-containing protein [Ditylenchus destructor]
MSLLDCFEDDDEHITLSDGEDESTEEIVEMKPISLMPLNMDMKPEIASSSEPEQIHFGEDQKIQDQRDSTTHKTSQSRKKRVHLDNVSGSSVEVKGNSQPKVRSQFKKKCQISHLQPSIGPKHAVDREKCHKCEHCHYATKYKGRLTEPMRIHTGEKPFKCQSCKYATAYRIS